MAISQFPAPSGGGLSNDFILDKNGTTNSTFQLGREFDAGGYALVTSSNDSSFDIYLLNAAGSSVGYTNGSAIVASGPFDSVVVYGVGTAETIQFSFRGPSTNATAINNKVGAGPFLTSIFPADLPNIDDTATVAGGNFASNVAITFESGTVVKSAKNVVVGSSTALVVTRPDDFSPTLAPYTLRAVNPGVAQPTGANVNLLVGTVTAGTTPSITNEAFLAGLATSVAYSSALTATDSPDSGGLTWSVTAGTVPPGITLNSGGTLAGTPTTNGDYFFTARVTDDGGNTDSKEFNAPVGPIISGANSTVVGGTSYYWFTTSGDLVTKNIASYEYIVIAGGGAGGAASGNLDSGGGGGAGGFLLGTISSPPNGTSAVIVGGGGAYVSGDNGSNGTDSLIPSVATATGGGGGGRSLSSVPQPGHNGGSGGGSGAANINTSTGGTAVAGQGNNGANSNTAARGAGGGGRGAAGSSTGSSYFHGQGGVGTAVGAWASAVNIIYNNGYFAAGGMSGGSPTVPASNALGGGGLGASRDSDVTATVGSANSGGGGGGAYAWPGQVRAGANGGSGLVIVRL
jgi:hypothetical protein